VAGHIWPAQLGFRGGKGSATMIGALLGYNYLIPLVLLVLFLVGFAVLRSITLSGMLGIALLPFVLLALGQPPPVVVSVALLAIIVLFANRTNIRARLSRRPSETS
jgi:acyl phosphate:glycerol-3-phosphate acyltransferase